MVVRIAAVGDVHLGEGSDPASQWPAVEEMADLLLLAGDLTRCGTVAEAEVVARAVEATRIPVVAVLGNHDVHSGHEEAIADLLRAAGAEVLAPGATVVEAAGVQVGISGTKGFGAGFPGSSCSEFGEPEMKAFVHAAKAEADALRTGLEAVADHADLVVALTHYAPCEDTLEGEPVGIWAFLGSYHLGEAIDDVGAHLSVHGHAHAGSLRGSTPGGVPVRNVARPVLKAPYAVLRADPARRPAGLVGVRH